MSERPSDWNALGLGGDPTPGDPVVVRDGATRYRGVADAIKRCADSLRTLEAGDSSQAESVKALMEQRDTLLDGIGRAEGRYRTAADALETYALALDRVQGETLNALYAARQAVWERDEARNNQRYYQDLADDYASIVAALANSALAIGGEKTWREALISVGFAALGCIGLGGLRGAAASLKALKGFGGALKAAGGLKGAFLTFGSGAVKAVNTGVRKVYGAGKTAWTATSKALKHASARVRIAANKKNLYVTGKTLRPGAKGKDLLVSKSRYRRRFGRRIKNPQEWNQLYRTGPGEFDFRWTNPTEVAGTKQRLTPKQYIERYGELIDRVGKPDGKWFAAVKDGKVFSFEARAVEEACKDLPYNQLTFPQELPDLQVHISQTAPNLGHPGGAIQVQFIQNDINISMADLIYLGVSKW